tara:strand:- start:1002 stop:1355 length:354 start_codon:yes stop_codon:yes gene_type:complete
MNKIIIFVIFLIIVILLEWLAQYCLNKSVNNFKWNLFILSIILYGLVAIFYYFCLKNYNNIGVANGIWNVASTLGISFIVGYFLLNEKFTLLQIIGFIVMTIGGILIIPYGNNDLNI